MNDLLIRAHGLSGMNRAKQQVFATFSPGRWAAAQTEGEPGAEDAFKAYEQRLFEWSFEQGVETVLEGRREGRRRREVVSWVIVFASAEGAQDEMREELAAVSHYQGASSYPVPGVPGGAGYGATDAHGRNGGWENVVFATGRCQATVGDSLHRRAPRRLADQPATVAAATLERRLAPLCA